MIIKYNKQKITYLKVVGNIVKQIKRYSERKKICAEKENN